jgi:hypothetical protein
MSVIDIAGGVDKAFIGHWPSMLTILDGENPANGSGVLDTFYIYPNTIAMTGCKIGTFYGSGLSYTMRDFVTIGNVPIGSTQVFPGYNCNVMAGDILGIFFTTGNLKRLESEEAGNCYYEHADCFVDQDVHEYHLFSNLSMAIYATGVSVAAKGCSLVKSNNWNKVLDAYLVDGGVVKDVQEGYVSVGGIWQKWWPPPLI